MSVKTIANFMFEAMPVLSGIVHSHILYCTWVTAACLRVPQKVGEFRSACRVVSLYV